jgi:hypothetical protein
MSRQRIHVVVATLLCCLILALASSSLSEGSGADHYEDAYIDGYVYGEDSYTDEDGNIVPTDGTCHEESDGNLSGLPLFHLRTTVTPLVNIEDDAALNVTRQLFNCRPDPARAAERVQHKIDQRLKLVGHELLSDVIQKLDDKVKKNELSEVQARIAKLTLTKDKLKLKSKLDQPELREIDMKYMNTNISIDDINATRDAEILNETIHNATKLKSLTYREKIHLQQKLKQTEWEAKSSQIFTVPLGLTCEGLICAACKALTSEYMFAYQSYLGANGKPPGSAATLINKQLCNSRNITHYYSPLVSFHCQQYYLNVRENIKSSARNRHACFVVCLVQYTLGYADLLFDTFSQIQDWGSVSPATDLKYIQEHVSTGNFCQLIDQNANCALGVHIDFSL